jgi:hypothetical protein
MTLDWRLLLLGTMGEEDEEEKTMSRGLALVTMRATRRPRSS